MPERFCFPMFTGTFIIYVHMGGVPASSGGRLTIKADLKGARQTELPLCFAEIILTPK